MTNEAKNEAEGLPPVPAPDEEMQQALKDGVALLVPLLDKVSRGMFLSARELPAGTAGLYTATLTLASLTSAFLGKMQTLLAEHGSGDVVEEYMSLLLPMLAQISPFVVDVGESRAFEEFLAKEMTVPEGITRQ
jgi:hypothetical protein